VRPVGSVDVGGLADRLRRRAVAGNTHYPLYTGGTVYLPVLRPHAAGNYAVQRTARELLVDALLRWRDTPWGGCVLLPVHDEIIAMVPEADGPAATAALVELYGNHVRGCADRGRGRSTKPVLGRRGIIPTRRFGRSTFRHVPFVAEQASVPACTRQRRYAPPRPPTVPEAHRATLRSPTVSRQRRGTLPHGNAHGSWPGTARRSRHNFLNCGGVTNSPSHECCAPRCGGHRASYAAIRQPAKTADGSNQTTDHAAPAAAHWCDSGGCTWRTTRHPCSLTR
jgi:hypothetical protein